jgi:urease accessory protein UreF
MVATGHISSLAGLESYVKARLLTFGSLFAVNAVIAWDLACRRAGEELDSAINRLEQEVSARMPSQAQRDTSRAQGRQLLRLITRIGLNIDPVLASKDLHHGTALGVASNAWGIARHATAQVAVYTTLSGLIYAAPKLMPTTPAAVAFALRKQEPVAKQVVAHALALADLGFDAIPRWSAPLSDIAAQWHNEQTYRLFSS